jgi:hypothetical protein
LKNMWFHHIKSSKIIKSIKIFLWQDILDQN